MLPSVSVNTRAPPGLAKSSSGARFTRQPRAPSGGGSFDVGTGSSDRSAQVAAASRVCESGGDARKRTFTAPSVAETATSGSPAPRETCGFAIATRRAETSGTSASASLPSRRNPPVVATVARSSASVTDSPTRCPVNRASGRSPVPPEMRAEPEGEARPASAHGAAAALVAARVARARSAAWRRGAGRIARTKAPIVPRTSVGGVPSTGRAREVVATTWRVVARPARGSRTPRERVVLSLVMNQARALAVVMFAASLPLVVSACSKKDDDLPPPPGAPQATTTAAPPGAAPQVPGAPEASASASATHVGGGPGGVTLTIPSGAVSAIMSAVPPQYASAIPPGYASAVPTQVKLPPGVQIPKGLPGFPK